MGFSVCMFVYRAQREADIERNYKTAIDSMPKPIRFFFPKPMGDMELDKLSNSMQIFYFTRVPRLRKRK